MWHFLLYCADKDCRYCSQLQIIADDIQLFVTFGFLPNFSYPNTEVRLSSHKSVGTSWVHTETYFLNLASLNHIWTVIALFLFIWHQTEFRIMPNISEKCNYNSNLVLSNKIQRIYTYIRD